MNFFSNRTKESLAPQTIDKEGVSVGRTSELKKDFLPAIEVRNTVIWSNPDLPFNIKEGESTPVALFLAPGKLTRSDEKLESQLFHKRSQMLDRVIFRDRYGNLYRDLDIKGGGHSESGKVKRVRPRNYDGAIGEFTEANGILKLGSAYHDKDTSEAFLKKGIRTHSVIAIIDLDEIVVSGVGGLTSKKISIEEALEEEILPENVKPVLELRAFGTKFRAEDLHTDSEEAGLLVQDAMQLINNELPQEHKLTNIGGYLQWFAKTLGDNIGKIHANGWYHGYLTGHNITLDCRIVDLDSVGWLKNLSDHSQNEKTAEDKIAARNTLENFVYIVISKLNLTFDDLGFAIHDILRQYNNAYSEVMENSIQK